MKKIAVLGFVFFLLCVALTLGTWWLTKPLLPSTTNLITSAPAEEVFDRVRSGTSDREVFDYLRGGGGPRPDPSTTTTTPTEPSRPKPGPNRNRPMPIKI